MKRQITNDYWIFVSNTVSVSSLKSPELPSLTTYICVYTSHIPTEEFNFLIWDSCTTVLFAGQRNNHNLCSGSKGGTELRDCSFLHFSWIKFPPGFMLWNSDDDSHYRSTWMPQEAWKRTRGSTQEWYKQAKQKHRVQVSRSPSVVPYQLEHGRIREHLWSWWGIYKDSCCREELAPPPVKVQIEEVGWSSQLADIIYW